MGIDIQRIAKIESLPREHFCPVCKLLINPNEALQSVCGHLYCKPCLTYVASTTRACPYDGCLVIETYAKPLVESNKMLVDTIGKTVVYCSYQSSGCTWLGSLADSLFHGSICAFGNSLVMCNWCRINIAHRQRQEHVQVCLGAYTQASVATTTTQASAQVHVVAPRMMTQEKWYQQPYQQYNENYVGDCMQQQTSQLQSFVPQHQVIYGKVRPAGHYVAQTHSQMQPQPHVQSLSLAMHQPHDAFLSPQANTIKDSLAQNTIGQYQSNQPHASWTGLNPQSNQTNHRASSTTDIDHKHMLQEGLSYHPHIAMQEHHQPITSIFGVQLNMNHFSATAPHLDLGHSAPSLPAVKEDDMQRIPKQMHWAPLGPNKVIHIFGNKDDEAVMEDFQPMLTSETTNDVYNVNRAAEVTTIKFDHKLKGKLTVDFTESVHRSNIVVEGSEMKNGPPDKQVMEENVGDGWEDLGKSLLIEKKGINNDHSLNGTPLMNSTLLDQDRPQQFRNLRQHYLMTAEKSRARSADSSLDRGFDQRSWVRTHEKNETGFELRPALKSSQPSMDLGFRRRPRSPISEHLGMPSHGYGPSGGRYALHMSEFKGLGNLQMGEKAKEHQQKSMDMVSRINHNEKAPSGSSRFGNQNKNEESRFKGSG